MTPNAEACAVPNCPACGGTSTRFGKHRNGLSRFRCCSCGKTHSTRRARLLGAMTVGRDEGIARARASTSHVERKNGSLRQWCKRMTRLTYAYSKKWEHHHA